MRVRTLAAALPFAAVLSEGAARAAPWVGTWSVPAGAASVVLAWRRRRCS
jgi:hypothetical protein